MPDVFGTFHLHPPAFGFFAFIKYDPFVVVGELNGVPYEIIGFGIGKIILAVVKPVDEVPYHLCHQVSRLAMAVDGRIHFENAHA